MEQFINGNPDNLEGKVVICADLYKSNPLKSKYIGVFASTEAADIEEIFYKKYDFPESSLSSCLRDIEKQNCTSSHTKINFFSLGFVEITKITEIVPISLQGDMINIGNFFDIEKVGDKMSETILDYAATYINQNFPNTNISEGTSIHYILPYQNKKYSFFLHSLAVPFDSYTKYKYSMLSQVIWEDYLFPLRKAYSNQNIKIADELKSRFHKFMDTSQSEDPFDFLPEINEIYSHLQKNLKTHDRIIDKYIEKFIALKHECYEDAANIQDKITMQYIKSIIKKK